ncbi:MAG: hypothetical protein M3Q13_07755, partial [Pseudomonadota bacterium]|nr:hypothetical protein [Pseudomonadota bacterium]
PLDTEERELAQRLARLGAPGEPSPSLDAKILAAARDAVARQPSSRTHRRARWPVAFGVAASLALAVGVAWQLRPLPQVPVYEESVSTTATDAATAGGGPSADAAAASAPMPPPLPAEPAERRDSSAREQAYERQADEEQAEVAADSDADVASGASAAKQAPIVSDIPVPIDTASSPPPPPPSAATSARPEFVPPPPSAPAAPPVEQRMRVEQPARAANMQSRPAPAQRAPAQPASTATSQSRNDTVLSDAAAAAEAGSEEGFDERPPNTADIPEVRQAWLQRIRELIASGDTAAARDSLQEFKRRYPGVVLPDDLRRFDRPL